MKISASLLKFFLKNGYEKPSKQAYEIHGYIRDNDLSGARVTVYFNPSLQHAIVTHKGTQSIQDWGTDIALATGWGKSTKRFHHSDKIQKLAESKYPNITTIGHSLGGWIAENSSNSGNVVTYNKASTPANLLMTIPKNQTDIRTTNDPISMFGQYQGNKQNLLTIDSGTFNPISAHSRQALNNNLDDDTLIGEGVSTLPVFKRDVDYSLSSSDITNFCNDVGLKKVTCVSRDDILPLQKNMVINLDPDMPGSHWVALTYCGSNAFYMDSFAQDPPQMISDELKRRFKKIYINRDQLQAVDDTKCGWFCIAFLLTMNLKKPTASMFRKFTNRFDAINQSNNTTILHDIIKEIILSKPKFPEILK